MVFDKKKKMNDEIIGFHFNNKYFCLKNNSWSLCDDNLITKYKAIDKIKDKNIKSDSDLMGIISKNKRNIVIFQLLDKKKYAGISLKNEIQSRKLDITGRVCETYDISDLSKLAIKLNMKRDNDKIVKSKICLEIEFMMRIKDLNDSKKRWFYNKLI